MVAEAVIQKRFAPEEVRVLFSTGAVGVAVGGRRSAVGVAVGGCPREAGR